MGAWAHFEEKEYETLMNAAFALDAKSAQSLHIFSPGQVLEATLGFDFAAHVSPRSALRRHLFGPLWNPGGINALQASARQIPRQAKFLNVFAQYKRPMGFLPGHRSNLWPSHEGYLRFAVPHLRTGEEPNYAQIRALDALQATFGVDAAVRYLCPAITDSDELYSAFAKETLLSRSVVVSVEALRDGTDYHRYWTFQPENLDIGIPNPGGPPDSSKSARNFFQNLGESKSNREDVGEFFHKTSRARAELAEKSGLLEEVRRWKPEEAEREDVRIKSAVSEEIQSLNVGLDIQYEIQRWVEVASIAKDLGVAWTISATP
jgi:hypothetical protein